MTATDDGSNDQSSARRVTSLGGLIAEWRQRKTAEVQPEATQPEVPTCSVCARSRQPMNPAHPMDSYDYSPFQVINGQPLGWYSGDDAEICPEDMAIAMNR